MERFWRRSGLWLRAPLARHVARHDDRSALTADLGAADLAVAAPADPLEAKFRARACVGVLVVELPISARLHNVGLNPKSNIKLITTAAALSMLGPEHRYVTLAGHSPAGSARTPSVINSSNQCR